MYNVTWSYVQATVLHGKAIRVTQSELVFVALGIQHALRISHIAICGLSGCTIFFHII